MGTTWLNLTATLMSCALVTQLISCAGGERKPSPTQLDSQPARFLNAFFGLDDALPHTALTLCRHAPGSDGMPVTFSRRVIVGSEGGADVDANAFTIITQSGARKTPKCATLKPAAEASEGHTVLLIGDFGDAQSDPPVKAAVTGSLFLEGDVNAKGLQVDVTPLREGPTMVLALGYLAKEVGSDCPDETKQVVMVVWAGGVRPGEGKRDEDHRQMYRVRVGDKSVVPFALGDLRDRDNYVHLCLKTEAAASSVEAAASVLVDPRGDFNPQSSCAVVR